MSEFKGRHFEGEISLWVVRWYCCYGVSYRDLKQMMGERGVSVDHSTSYRRVETYAPEMEKRMRWQWRTPRSTSWRVRETYVKVRGQWTYLYRAVDKHGNTIDFCLSPTPQYSGGEALPWQGVEWFVRMGEANSHKHRQGVNLCSRPRRVEEGG